MMKGRYCEVVYMYSGHRVSQLTRWLWWSLVMRRKPPWRPSAACGFALLGEVRAFGTGDQDSKGSSSTTSVSPIVQVHQNKPDSTQGDTKRLKLEDRVIASIPLLPPRMQG